MKRILYHIGKVVGYMAFWYDLGKRGGDLKAKATWHRGNW